MRHDDDRGWVYTSDQVLVSDDPDRACGHCMIANTPEGHDPCLGTLPGVMNACCGHGDASEAYVQFESGMVMRGAFAMLGLRRRTMDGDTSPAGVM
jgi:hypothetical protein